jgi:hypothetical protein
MHLKKKKMKILTRLCSLNDGTSSHIHAFFEKSSEVPVELREQDACYNLLRKDKNFPARKHDLHYVAAQLLLEICGREKFYALRDAIERNDERTFYVFEAEMRGR